MFDDGTDIVMFVLNIITFVFTLITFLISIIVLIYIIYDQIKSRMTRQERIILILSANLYSYIFLYNILQFLGTIGTALGDLFQLNFDSSACKFNGYLIVVLLCALYYGFVVQAIFRLCRIVYSSYRWLQFYWFYIVVAPFQLLLGFLLLCPLLVWNDVVYLPNEYYCFVLFTNIRGMICLSLSIYYIPLLLLILIYVRIIIYIRRQANNQSLLVKRTQERDLLAMKRIFTTVKILFTLATPTTVLLIMAFITGVEQPLTHRITMLSYAITMTVLSIQTIFVTPLLKTRILKTYRRNRVVPLQNDLHGTLRPGQIATIK